MICTGARVPRRTCHRHRHRVSHAQSDRPELIWLRANLIWLSLGIPNATRGARAPLWSDAGIWLEPSWDGERQATLCDRCRQRSLPPVVYNGLWGLVRGVVWWRSCATPAQCSNTYTK